MRDPNRRHLPLAEHLVEVIDDKQTGETILDEALKMMRGQQTIEKLSINSWIDLMSGETWNVMKIGFQLKQRNATSSCSTWQPTPWRMCELKNPSFPA